MMPILVKSDDIRSGRKAKACHGRLQAAQESMGQQKNLKSKFCGIPGVFGLGLDRCPKFITKGPIFWKIGSCD